MSLGANGVNDGGRGDDLLSDGAVRVGYYWKRHWPAAGVLLLAAVACFVASALAHRLGVAWRCALVMAGLVLIDAAMFVGEGARWTKAGISANPGGRVFLGTMVVAVLFSFGVGAWGLWLSNLAGRRTEANRCIRCGYPRIGWKGRCPECGTPVAPE